MERNFHNRTNESEILELIRAYEGKKKESVLREKISIALDKKYIHICQRK